MKFISTLAVLLLGVQTGGPGFAAGSLALSPAALALQTAIPKTDRLPNAKSPPVAITPAQIMQMKMQAVCARSDRNLDGFITRAEFEELNKPETIFDVSDADRDGLLSLRECKKALGSS